MGFVRFCCMLVKLSSALCSLCHRFSSVFRHGFDREPFVQRLGWTMRTHPMELIVRTELRALRSNRAACAPTAKRRWCDSRMWAGGRRCCPPRWPTPVSGASLYPRHMPGQQPVSQYDGESRWEDEWGIDSDLSINARPRPNYSSLSRGACVGQASRTWTTSVSLAGSRLRHVWTCLSIDVLSQLLLFLGVPVTAKETYVRTALTAWGLRLAECSPWRFFLSAFVATCVTCESSLSHDHCNVTWSLRRRRRRICTRSWPLSNQLRWLHAEVVDFRVHVGHEVARTFCQWTCDRWTTRLESTSKRQPTSIEDGYRLPRDEVHDAGWVQEALNAWCSGKALRQG